MKYIYVPTGEIRRPNCGEWFCHPNWQRQLLTDTNVHLAVDGKKVVRCIWPSGCPADGEIYEEIKVNA